ncbi:hypothetical protein X474_02450 [Dethiosulfatarculus sandiegensis]|uniref:Uncharacterized protein n=1 Tax=Dethiosulfatarculus sandiegensis TaxID=1429043 RepID=A0A0D2GLX4_9BACT|nr:hypothetical protein X474_02450 [Dethiosulfatarculus sandiegensis]
MAGHLLCLLKLSLWEPFFSIRQEKIFGKIKS